MTSLFWKLEKLGRVKLSKNFQFRQFLYSEIAIAHNIINIPDNEELALAAGKKLCENILEPLVDEFGPLIIRSGFRCARLNQFGYEKGLKCSSNKENYAYHIWDHLDENGHMGAAACILIPSFNEGLSKCKTREELTQFIEDNLDYHRLKFFAKDNAFNIGWIERVA